MKALFVAVDSGEKSMSSWETEDRRECSQVLLFPVLFFKDIHR